MCLSEHQKKAKSMEVDSKLVSQYISERKGSTRNVNFHLEALESADLKCLQKTEKLSEEFPDSCCLDPFIEFKRNLTSTEEYSKNDVCDCYNNKIWGRGTFFRNGQKHGRERVKKGHNYVIEKTFFFNFAEKIFNA